MSTTDSAHPSSALLALRFDREKLEAVLKDCESSADVFEHDLSKRFFRALTGGTLPVNAVQWVDQHLDGVNMLREHLFPDLCYSAGRIAGYQHHAMIFTDRPVLVRYCGTGPTEARARLAAVLRGILATVQPAE